MELQAIQNFIDAHPLVVVIVMAWSLIWKGLALWQSGGRRERNWFIILLILNTLGILEIIYLFFVLPRRRGALVPTPESESEKAS